MSGYGEGTYSYGEFGSGEPSGPVVPVYDNTIRVNAIYSSYLGDFEFDIGKSIRWAQYFAHTSYALDTDAAYAPRNWSIAWDQTYPEVKVSYSSDIVWHRSPTEAAAWRQRSFERADAEFGYGAEEWVLFLDATEGLTFDKRVEVVDHAGIGPFYMWLASEIEQAKTVGATSIALPYFGYVDSEPVKYQPTIIDPALHAQTQADKAAALALPAGDGRDAALRDVKTLQGANQCLLTYAVPRYAQMGASTRLVRVDVLRDPDFDWHSLDRLDPAPGSINAGVTGLITYAYARWAIDPLDRNPNGTAVSEAVDVGWESRKLMSRVRPSGVFQAADWFAVDTASTIALPGPDLVQNTTGVVEPLGTPIYSNIVRFTPRDGVFYLPEQVGPVPWDHIHQLPAIDPFTWDNQPTSGVGQQQ